MLALWKLYSDSYASYKFILKLKISGITKITVSSPFMNQKWLITYHCCCSNNQDLGTVGDTIRPTSYEYIESSNVTPPGVYDTCDIKESGYGTAQWQ